MDRRRLLMGLAALGLAQTACGRNADPALRIMALNGVVPPQLLGDLKATLPENAQVRLQPQKSWANLIQQLQTWQAADSTVEGSTVNRADWVCMSDYWLWSAIQQEWISPLRAVTQLSGWSDLPNPWQRLLQRNQQGLLSDTGTYWGTPYRWGYLAMVYNRQPFERLGWQPSTWSDLLRPEIQGKIALPNHPRLVLGMMLKSLGYSANVRNPEAYEDVRQALESLQSQVKVYASNYYLQSLVMKDVWLAVGWSTEIQPLLSRYRQFQMAVPAPGTLLSADVWVKPQTLGQAAAIALTPLDQQWLTYWWQSQVITPLSLFSQGLSPQLLSPDTIATSEELSQETTLPSAKQLQQSEFIEPLETEAIANYERLWRQLRGSK